MIYIVCEDTLYYHITHKSCQNNPPSDTSGHARSETTQSPLFPSEFITAYAKNICVVVTHFWLLTEKCQSVLVALDLYMLRKHDVISTGRHKHFSSCIYCAYQLFPVFFYFYSTVNAGVVNLCLLA